MKKKKTKAKLDYIQDRVMSGNSPHKLIRLEMQKYLDSEEADEEKSICEVCTLKIACDSCAEFVWDVFEMDKHTWRDLK